jgi:hypothetical protein
MTKKTNKLAPIHLTSVFRGLYFRVAKRLGVDPSYVSRVARGERRSEAIETALIQETYKIMKSSLSDQSASISNGDIRRSVTNKRQSKSLK